MAPYRTHTLLSSSSICAFLLLSPSLINADLPLVDFNRMGKVGLAGAFAGLDLFSNSSTSVSLDPSTSTLLSRSSDGELTRLGSTNSGGSILATCALGDTLYVAGRFNSLGGVSVNNIAAYDPSSGTFSALGSSGPDADVLTLFCDSTRQNLWAGGRFSSPAPGVAVWNPSSSSWSAPPFGGLTGAASEVSSITTNASQSSLFFSGSFVTAFGNGTRPINGSNNPNVPFSAGATPFSSSLVPVPLDNAQITASPTTTEAGFDNVTDILCPAGPDGPDNTWFAQDGGKAVITVRKFAFLSASGIRLGNTFLNRSTVAFSVTTIPDNTVRELHYTDPHTGQNATCTDPCPLLADPTIPYQDFLFDNAANVTGFQLTLEQWNGDGPGLHLLQLLSTGAFASAITSDNGQSCFAPNPSNTTQTGNWTEKDADTDIPGTTQDVLVSTVAVGDGLPPSVTTVSQQNTDDATTLIYSGPVVPSSDSFSMTVTMALADQPAGSGQDGQYELVADRVQLVLTSANVTGTTTTAAPGTSGSGETGFGFFEWPLSSTTSVNATGVLPNGTQTALDEIGVEVLNSLGGGSNVLPTGAVISAVAHHPSGSIILGGSFQLSAGAASGSSNIVVFKNGNLSSMSSNGLNGPVTSMLLDGDILYVGGSFTDTKSASTQGKLGGVAMYNVPQDQWTPLQTGLAGSVSSLALAEDAVLVAGNFTGINGGEGGFLVGQMTLVGNSTAPSKGETQSQVVAGNVAASLQFGAPGFVMLQNGGSNGVPDIMPLQAQLGGGSALSSSPSVSKRHHPHTRRSPIAWIPRIGNLFKRQNSGNTLAPLPSPSPAIAPAVLAGAYWTNSSSSHEVVILGGNFSFTSSSGASSVNVAIYDPQAGTLTAIQGSQVNGTVRSLLVQGDDLFVGGTFTVGGTNFNGFAVYNLAEQEWDATASQPLQGSSGAAVVVRSITSSPSQDNTLIVAGSFAQAGSVTCRAVCAYNIPGKSWSALGSGIQGEVSAVDYAGSSLNSIVVAGSLALADGTGTNVASFAIANQSWSAVGNSGDLPGPVTAMDVNDGNSSSIFAAGKTTDGSNSFLFFWNGQTWSSVGSGFEGSLDVSQLTMVPLQNTHSANSIIEPDRMLWISGTLSDTTFGNASSALFDGQQIIPYIVSSSSSGSPGMIAALIHSFATFSFTQHHFLATGIVILISIAISAGVVFLLALIGIIWTIFARKDERVEKLDAADFDDDDSTTHRPSSLLEHINAATRTTIIGQSPFPQDSEKEAEAAAMDVDAGGSFRADTPSDTTGGVLGTEEIRPARARFSFEAENDGELPMFTGQEVEILDDRDTAWWYARDPRTGREGVIPAAYVY
ncbi:hypothetical protein NM688_g5377 [Phlebia brevispora]|uniref:Uncharacterized protein n=1 Tax=Phlebia brevispora TaxID=194682 RepID=A0ACC1SWC6_9APHY|nr:hypothetical protein NM688_g5377 [Phlebia brevispora]